MKLSHLFASAAAIALLAPGVLLSAPVPASAAALIWDFTGTPATFTNGNWDFGNDFYVTKTVTAIGLAYWNSPITEDHPVSLYTGAGAFLASTTVIPGDPLIGNGGGTGWAWDAISPVVLTPGLYQVDGASTSDNYTWNTIGFGTAPGITYVGNIWTLNGGDAYQGGALINDVGNGYWGPNVVTSVPEPATWALLVLGFAGLGFAGYYRARATVSAA